VGAPAPPRAVKKIFWRNLQVKCVSEPPRTRSAPPARARVFRTVFAGRVRFGGIFRRSLRATTKKGRQLFLARKSAPPDKILATPILRWWNVLSHILELGEWRSPASYYTLTIAYKMAELETLKNIGYCSSTSTEITRRR